MVAFGVWLAASSGRAVGLCIIGCGLNYALLAAYAIALGRPGCMGPAMPVVCLSIPSAREDLAGGPRAVVPGTGESGAEVLLPAGLGSCTGLYVAVRGIGGEGPAHVHMADSVAGKASLSGVYAGQRPCGGAGRSGL